MLSAWKELLYECRTWIELKLPDNYHWEREWQNLGNHAWEIFWGSADSIELAMDDLERRKLSRSWTALNWIGESSSMTGADAIAFPDLGAETRNPNNRVWRDEKAAIERFYRRLGCFLENLPLDAEPEGTLVAKNEKISIGELVKRLIAIYSTGIAKKLNIPRLEEGFSDIYRRPENITESKKGRWTGWFMGDGDEVGKHLKNLAKVDNSDEEVKRFSSAMCSWGESFAINFRQELGRVIYAGGDDFLGVIYSEEKKDAVKPQVALDWLIKLPLEWEKHQQNITVSVGFIWAGHSVPQRDILQHCREAEKKAKSLGRNRVTIRVVFNSGQYIEWTCPWDYLKILSQYQDLDGKSNWTHIYTDLAHLEAKSAFNIDKRNFNQEFIFDFFDIYFPGEGQNLSDYDFAKHVIGFTDENEGNERIEKIIDWMRNLIKVGFQLCSNT
ncbi:Cas10/Cmr2 second palm domain-containing protein [Brunnivagina elsteri]|uniref:Cas10/Cmr2 second palm domain-containing protein n=1 Tax=Brunnivagina elsteri TaxID=1247191 RepID=UPI0011778AF9|nr:CRISPR-associated protein Cmr2 [Calothrix elsteri]